MAAMVLTQAGANVVMLEAGPMWDATLDTAMYKWPYQTPRRGAATPERHFGEFDAALGGWSLDGEPYTSAPGSQFDWFRSRMLGGRTNHWGRISLRFGPDDFRRKSIDGLGDDWPITYDDIKPYYDKIDQFIGIFGANLPDFPNEPDGIFLPPPTPRCYELLIKRASKKLNIPSVPSRLSILTRPLNGRAGLPLLQPVRPRLLDALELLVPVGADSAGAEDRPAEDHHQRDGPRGDRRHRRAGQRRHLRRQGHVARQPRPRPHRRGGGERVRVGAHPAQLEVGEVPAGPRQLERRTSAST